MRLDHLLSKENRQPAGSRLDKTESDLLFNFEGVAARSLRQEYGGVAQLGEHLPCKQGVMGSNPIISIHGGRHRDPRAHSSGG